ncbi:MAG TPA: mechanosensitive ion channel family protein, partial [Alphaproteobacteria bacterium]|nr:mechanosensitive ion channel family protein [Alphaproteobacteria bacterium]
MTNLNANLQQLYTRISEVLLLYGMDLLGALAILLIGWWLASRAQHAVERWLSRLRRFDDTLKPFLGALARYVVLALTLIAVLAQFGVETTSIIAVLGAAGLAVG